MAISCLGHVADKNLAGAGTYAIDISSLDLEDGDLIVVWYGSSSASGANLTMSLPVGDESGTYTQVTADLFKTDTRSANGRAAMQWVAGTPDGSITVPGAGTAAYAAGVVVGAYRGVDPDTPLDVAVQTATGGNTAAADPPSITPTTTGARVVAGWFCSGPTSQTHFGLVSPFTPVGGLGAGTGGGGSTAGMSISMGVHPDEWTSGAVDPGAYPGGGVQNAWVAFTMALRPDPAGSEVEGAAALSGTGTLAAAAEVDREATAALSGSGTLTATAEADRNATAALSGSGTLTATAEVEHNAAAALAGSGSLAATAEVDHNASAALTGTGTLTAAGTIEGVVTGEADLTGTGTLTAAAEVDHNATVALTGTGTLTATAEADHHATVALSGTGTLTAAAEVDEAAISGEAHLSGTGTLTAAAEVEHNAAVALTGTGTLTATGTIPGEVIERFGGSPYGRRDIDRMVWEQQLEELLREDEEILCLV